MTPQPKAHMQVKTARRNLTVQWLRACRIAWTTQTRSGLHLRQISIERVKSRDR